MDLILISILAFMSTTIFAGEINKLAQEEFLRAEKILQATSKEKLEFNKYKQTAAKNIEKHKKLINNVIELSRRNRKNISEQKIKPAGLNLKKTTPKAIIFVSFSMSDLSLKQIIKDAARYQMPVVVRGLINNSFKKTAIRIFELVKGNNQGGIAINPIWFKRYSIYAVPACVVSAGDNFDVIYGNIRIKNMLEIIVANGTTGISAQTILAGVKG